MKILLILIVLLIPSCGKKPGLSDSVPIRIDKTNPDFKDITRYNLELTTLDSTNWFLTLSGHSSYLDTLMFEGDTVVTIASAQLVVDQEIDFRKLSYDKQIFELDSLQFIPKMSGESFFIFETPQGIDTAIIKVDANLIPKLSAH
jgi:hypothetical protein